MELNDVLIELIELQRLDSGLDELEKHNEKFLNDLADIDTRIQMLKNRLQNDKKTLEELVKRRKALDIEVATLDSHIAKYILQQNDVKNNDQVTALGQEIDKSKIAKAQTEEKMLEILMQEDEQKTVIQTSLRELDEEEKKAVSDKAVIQMKIDDCKKALIDKRQERAVQLTKVAAPYDRGYENLRSKGKKIAVAYVTEDHTCSGCNMNVAPQILHDIRKKTAIISCPCGRYLYFKDES